MYIVVDFPGIAMCQPKNRRVFPQIIHLFIGLEPLFSLFTIHFGGKHPLFCETPIYTI